MLIQKDLVVLDVLAVNNATYGHSDLDKALASDGENLPPTNRCLELVYGILPANGTALQSLRQVRVHPADLIGDPEKESFKLLDLWDSLTPPPSRALVDWKTSERYHTPTHVVSILHDIAEHFNSGKWLLGLNLYEYVLPNIRRLLHILRLKCGSDVSIPHSLICAFSQDGTRRDVDLMLLLNELLYKDLTADALTHCRSYYQVTFPITRYTKGYSLPDAGSKLLQRQIPPLSELSSIEKLNMIVEVYSKIVRRIEEFGVFPSLAQDL